MTTTYSEDPADAAVTEKGGQRPIGTVDPSFFLIGIGASAGGLGAIKSLVHQIPKGCAHSFVIVQHLAPDHKSLLAELLQRETSLTVVEVENGMVVEPAHIYLIPPRANIIIEGTSTGSTGLSEPPRKPISGPLRFALLEKPPRHQLNLPIDLFFHSLAEAVADRAVGVVLSGTGTDGSRGLLSIKDVDGLGLAQEPETAEFSGMPLAAIQAGGVDLVLPPGEMVEEVLRYFETRGGEEAFNGVLDDADDELFNDVLALVSERTGVNYTSYKPATLRRRIARRIVLGEHAGLAEYHERLRTDPAECEKLGREFLVGVTSFFRDKAAWDDLEQDTFDRLFSEGEPEKPVKVWCVGCSTGEEAYSIAAAFERYRSELSLERDFRVFATDLNADSIEYARAGVYASAVHSDIPDAYQRILFHEDAGDTRTVCSDLRTKVVFAPHDALQHPPYIDTDLILCRNVLIYLSAPEQARIVDNFSYSLREGGVLFLGLSETPDRGALHFTPISKRSHIYENGFPRSQLRRGPGDGKYFDTEPHGRTGGQSAAGIGARRHRRGLQSIAEAALQAANTCAVIVDNRLNVQSTLGDYKKVLLLPEDGFSSNLTELLPTPMNTLILQGVRHPDAASEEGWVSTVSIETESGPRAIKAAVRALPGSPHESGLSVITFHFGDTPASGSIEPADDGGVAPDAEASALREELRITRQALENTIAELAEANEQLQTANEELMATNEELQATNEELQSVNEELYTVNAEHAEKIQQLEIANSDIDSFLALASVQAIFLDEDERIRRFSHHPSSIFDLRAGDIGRRLSNFSSRLKPEDHQRLLGEIDYALTSPIEARKAAERLARGETEDDAEPYHDADGRHHIVRVIPNLDGRERPRGAMVSFVDVTQMERLREEVERRRSLLEVMIESQLAGYWDWDLNDNTEYLSPSFKAMFGYADDEMENSPDAWQAIIHPEDLPKVMETFDKHVASRGRIPFTNEVRYFHKDGSIVWVWSKGAVVEWDDDGAAVRMVGAHIDITALKDKEAVTEDRSEELSRFVFVAAHDLREPMTTIEGFIRLFEQDLAAGRTDRKEKILETIREASGRMRKLIEGVLEYAQLISDESEDEVVDLNLVFDEAREALAGALDDADGDLEIDALPNVSGRPSMLTHVAVNLLSNAIKYRRPDEAPFIRVSAAQDQGQVTISVEDNGIGIDPAYRESVFGMFRRLHTRQDYDGIGLGLAHCRKIVELHGGRIWVADNDGPGTRIQFTLPAAEH